MEYNLDDEKWEILLRQVEPDLNLVPKYASWDG